MTGIIDPARFGMPDATTAGVPTGTTLTAYTGPMTITKDGTVIEGMIIDGTLVVDAANVTIKNCVIKNYGWWGIDGEGAALPLRLPGDRERVRQFSTISVLNLLRQRIQAS